MNSVLKVECNIPVMGDRSPPAKFFLQLRAHIYRLSTEQTIEDLNGNNISRPYTRPDNFSSSY